MLNSFATLAVAKKPKTPDQLDVTVTKENNGAEVKLWVHRTLRIQLPENPSTGFGWQMNGLNGAVLTQKNTSYKRDGNAPGSGGTRTFEIQAIGPGRQMVSLELKRAWERERQSVERFSVTVEVVRNK